MRSLTLRVWSNHSNRPETMNRSEAAVEVRGVVAIELQGGQAPARAALDPATAGELAQKLARDLAEHAPRARELDLIVAAAHFDPAEALRPGWPLHRRLRELGLRAPGGAQGPRIIAFGADADGAVPQPLQADPDLRGGSLRVLPFVLSEPKASRRISGDADAARAVDEQFEAMLLERGMAAADTALLAQQAFGAPAEHIRYLTVHDLAAMTAMQYQHQGLDRLWPLIETALLQPDVEEWLDDPPEPLLRYAGGEVRIALFDPDAWRRRYAPDPSDRARLEHGFQLFQARQRQYAAVLGAHDIPVQFVHCGGSDGADSLR